MKTISKEELARSYATLYPDELISPNNTPEQCLEQIIEINGRWLDRYLENPQDAISGANWYGKNTKALFHALKIKQPKTVKAMLDVLLREE